MFRKSVILFVSFLFFYQLPINAVCSEIVVANKSDTSILFVNDRHVDQVGNKKGLMQRKHLIEHFSLLNNTARRTDDRPLLIVEDMLYCENQSEKVQQYIDNESLLTKKHNESELEKTKKPDDQEFSIEDTISVLGNLVFDSVHANLDCYNAECRQAKWVSRNEDFVIGHEIATSFEDNVAEIMHDLEMIKNDAVNDTKAQIVYDACMRIMGQNERMSQSSIEYLKTSSKSLNQLEKENLQEFVQNYNSLHDLYLIDARILIAWYKNRSRKMIGIIAGEFHLENVIPVFEELGFAISRFGEKYSKDEQGMMLTVQNALNVEEFFKDNNAVEAQSFKVVDNDLLLISEPLFEDIISANSSTIELL